MKKNYYYPQAEFIAILSNDVITNSPVDDHKSDIFGGASNDIPQVN